MGIGCDHNAKVVWLIKAVSGGWITLGIWRNTCANTQKRIPPKLMQLEKQKNKQSWIGSVNEDARYAERRNRGF